MKHTVWEDTMMTEPTLVILTNPGSGKNGYGALAYSDGEVTYANQQIGEQGNGIITTALPHLTAWKGVGEPVEFGVFLLNYTGDDALMVPGWKYCPCRHDDPGKEDIFRRFRLDGRAVVSEMTILQTGKAYGLIRRDLGKL